MGKTDPEPSHHCQQPMILVPRDTPGLEMKRVMTPRALRLGSLSPSTVQWILDKAIQTHGGGGVSQDFPLAYAFAQNRTLRFADGPDEVHKNALAKAEIAKATQPW